jgi:hypothetical protein
MQDVCRTYAVFEASFGERLDAAFVAGWRRVACGRREREEVEERERVCVYVCVCV